MTDFRLCRDRDAGVEGLLGEERWGWGRGLRDGFAYQRAGKDLGDAHVDVAADRRDGVASEVDGLVLSGAAGDLASGVGAVLDHDGHGLIQMAGVVAALNLALASVEDGEAFDFYFFGDRILHVDGRGVGAGGVFEAVNRVVAYLFEERDGVFEVLVGLAGEANDDVRRERDVAPCGFGPGNALEVPVAGVVALHGLEDGGAAGLDGEMDVVAEGGDGVDDVDDVAGEVAGVRGGKADALNARDFAYGGEEFGEGALAGGIMVAVDVLAQELDLGEARLGDALGFGEDGGGGAGAFFSAGVGNDAVGAEFVAAFDDGNVAAVGVGAGGELGVEGLVGLAVVEAGDASLAGFEAGEHVGEIAVAGGAGNDGDVGGLLEDFGAFLLGDAADDGEALPFTVELLVLVEAMEDFSLGVFFRKILYMSCAEGGGWVDWNAGTAEVAHKGVLRDIRSLAGE
jgi:hypothetical protein